MTGLADRLAQLSPDQRAMLLARLGRAPTVRARIRTGQHGRVRPLSATQERLWFLEQYAPHQPFNVMSGVARVPFAVDPQEFAACLDDVVARHEILRTSFGIQNGEPVAVLADRVAVPVRVLDEPDPEALEAEFERDARTPFDLTIAPLLRMTLVPRPDHTLIQLTLHHLVSDGFSNGVLFAELAQVWRARSRGRAPDLPELPFQFADVVEHERSALVTDGGRASVEHWVRHLTGAPERLTLPTSRRRPPRMSYRGARLPVELPPGLLERVRTTAVERTVTPFVVVLAAWAAVLARFAAQDEVVIGVPVAGREESGTDLLVGPFLNTIAIRVDVAHHPTFAALVDHVGAVVNDGMRHQDASFEEVLRALRTPRDPARSPVFQAMLNFQAGQTGGNDGFELRDLHNGSAQFDLRLDLVSTTRGLSGHLDYASDVYDEESVTSIVEALLALLDAALTDPSRAVATLPLLSASQTRQAVSAGSARLADEPVLEGETVHAMVLRQARLTPDVTAIRTDTMSLTYAELDAASVQLAGRLRRLVDASAGSRIGLLLPRSAHTVVAMLAVLRCGWSYIPLDPDYPSERLAFICQDAGVAGLMALEGDVQLVDTLLGPESVIPVLTLDGSRPPGEDTADGPPEDIAAFADKDANSETAAPDTGAYAAEMYTIYTSGSTGLPKGVQVGHRSVVNFLLSMAEEPGLAPGDVLLAVTSPSFDIAVLELFLPLTVGATVVVASQRDVSDGNRLQTLLEAHHVTVMQATPSTWQILLTSGWAGNQRLLALCGGEALPTALAERLVSRVFALWNMYGPTETTIWSTIHAVTESDLAVGSVPIGRPIRRTSAFVLDQGLQPVPPGVLGELCLGGDGLALGYLDRPGLTADRFITSPEVPDQTLYRTGDLVLARPDGVLEYSSRLDTQVKLRGHRIELEEIETVLDRHPDVGRSVSVVLGKDDNQELVAYAEPTVPGTPAPDDVRTWLAGHLPAYMIPGRIGWLDRLPLTPNGKVDRKALLTSVPSLDEDHRQVGLPSLSGAPMTPTEELLVTVWRELLDRDDIGLDEGFFTLGGHSLMATKLIFLVRERAGVELPLQVLFEGEPTVRRLAALLEQGPDQSEGHAQELDLAAEAVLPVDIRPDPNSHVHSVVSPQHPLVTGGTGFMGSFLLAEILRTTHAVPFCHVRAATPGEGLARLRETMQEYGIWDDSYADRIIPVPGDLSRPRIGLSRPMWDHLAETVDSIFHCGAEVNFLTPYQALKPANVRGTEVVLRLAVDRTTKPVHFVSTTYVFSRFAYPPHTVFTEDMEPIHDLTHTFGYTQSKWVSEQLVAEAGRRGLPTYIYRAGRVAGDSTTGACQTYDFVWQAVKAAVEMGAAPDIDMLIDVTPADYVVSALVHIARQPQQAGKAFHLVSPEPVHEPVLVDWMVDRGYSADRLPFDDWCARIVDRAAHLSDRTAGALAPFFSGILPLDEMPPATFRADAVEEALEGSGITCPPITAELIGLYLDYFVQVGFLPTPEQQQTTTTPAEATP